jgi:hypothetical protein
VGGVCVIGMGLKIDLKIGFCYELGMVCVQMLDHADRPVTHSTDD